MNSIDWLHGVDCQMTKNVLYKVINWIKKDLYFLIWARSKPKKDVLKYFISFANSLQKTITIWIDDVTPSVLYNRTKEQQGVYNKMFKDFLQEHWVEGIFISEYFTNLSQKKLVDFIDTIKEVDYSSLCFILPEKKRHNDTLSTIELIHFYIQREILSILSSNNASFLVWKFSAWFYYYYNNKEKKISFIILNKCSDVYPND